MLKKLFGKKTQNAQHAAAGDADDAQAPLGTDAMADALAGMPGDPDLSKMNALQRMAWKQFQKMSPEKQRAIVKKAMTPKNIQKNKGAILKQLDEMKAAGMMSDDQYRLAKRKLGL